MRGAFPITFLLQPAETSFYDSKEIRATFVSDSLWPEGTTRSRRRSQSI
ncbi:hypothetical protein CBM2626_B30102 [Cupriavidus taiwanensis]|nr:hypothetical protein CBM2626_B30102 [Cupriavidus taiwanensis]